MTNENIEKVSKISLKYKKKNSEKFFIELDKIIAEEYDYLISKDMFKYKGEFWSIEETRDYLILLFYKLSYAKKIGHYKMATNLAEYILELNESDNLGIRFILLSLYAILEDEKIEILHKKYNSITMELFPVAIYYLKIQEYKKAKNIFKKIKKTFPDFIEVITEIFFNIDELLDIVDQDEFSYTIGEYSELLELVSTNFELINNSINLIHFNKL